MDEDSTLRALVSVIEDDQDGWHRAGELHARLCGIGRAEPQRVMDQARKTCPIPKSSAATRPSGS